MAGAALKGYGTTKSPREMMEAATHIYVRSEFTQIPKRAVARQAEEYGVRIHQGGDEVAVEEG